MAHFLFTLWPMDTHTRPGLAVAQVLRQRGHEVTVFTSPEASHEFKAEGFSCFAFQTLDEAHVNRIVAGLMEHWDKPWRTRRLWRQFLVDTMPAQIHDIEYVLDRCSADVIVCDMAMWSPMLVLSETRRIPVAVLSHVGYCILPGERGVHPGVSSSLRGGLLSRFYARMLSTFMRIGASGIQRGVSALRVAHRLPPLNMTVVEYTSTMPLYLVPSSPGLDYDRDDLPPSVHYVGSYVRRDMAVVKTQPPSVLVMEGTNHGVDPWLLQLGRSALSGQPVNGIIVAGLDRKENETQIQALIPGIRLLSLGDREKLIAGADVVVTGGSSEIVLAALSYGVPLVLVPSILEESAMSQRVSDYGAGLLIPAKRCTPTRLKSAIEQVLKDLSFRNRALIAAETFRSCGGPDRAASLLEQLSSAAMTGNLSRGTYR